MSFKDKFRRLSTGPEVLVAGEAQGSMIDPALGTPLDPDLEEALKSFRSSVHAWSDAVYNRPRPVAAPAFDRKVWRLAAAWALAFVLVAGGVSGGILERHHRQEMAMIAAQREAEHQKQIAAERAREEEELLAKVDSDVSREVPSAMEPLALLMAEDETR
jgi:hypothetical protein